MLLWRHSIKTWCRSCWSGISDSSLLCRLAGCWLLAGWLAVLPRKHETLKQCWLNVGPASLTLAQHSTYIGSTSRVFWLPWLLVGWQTHCFSGCCLVGQQTGRIAACCWQRARYTTDSSVRDASQECGAGTKQLVYATFNGVIDLPDRASVEHLAVRPGLWYSDGIGCTPSSTYRTCQPAYQPCQHTCDVIVSCDGKSVKDRNIPVACKLHVLTLSALWGIIA